MSKGRQSLPAWAAEEIFRRFGARAGAEGRFPSERTMATELEVSLPTLREGLLRLETEGRIIRKHGKGTFLAPEPSLAKPVGILIEYDLTKHSAASHYLPLALYIQRQLKAVGRRAQIYFGDRQADDHDAAAHCDEFVDAARSGQFSGVAVVAGLRSEDWLAPLRERGIPVVGNNSLFDGWVTIDRDYWITRALETLKADGRRRIAYIGWTGRRPPNPGMIPGDQHFMECLRKQGMAVDPKLIRSDLPPSMEGAGWEEFREIWLRPASERPDGLVVSDDILLCGALEAIEESQIGLPRSLHVVALVSDYLRGQNLSRISRFEICTRETASRFVQALLAPGKFMPPLRPYFHPVISANDKPEDRRTESPNHTSPIHTYHENKTV